MHSSVSPLGISVVLATVALILPASPAGAQKTIFVPAEPTREVRQYQKTPRLSVERVATRIHELINEVRRASGLPPLKRDADLEKVGRDHSADMANNGYFDHVDLRGMRATDRAHRAKYVCLVDLQNPVPLNIGENLFAGFRYHRYRLIYYSDEIVAEFDWKTEEEFARETVDGWMDSPPHRKNLLDGRYRLHGVGVYLSKSMELFVTQNLC